MCMKKSIGEHSHYSLMKIEKNSSDEFDIIAFGPIKVRPRKKPAPTLATGRRSKYEILSPDEEQKRNLRRARNRAAAERVRISRLNIEQQLLNQIHELEQQQTKLMQNIQILENEKLHLESRLFTHEQICYMSVNSQVNQTSSHSFLTSIQFNDTAINRKICDIDVDDLLLTNEQLQQDYISPSNNFDDFIMNTEY